MNYYIDTEFIEGKQKKQFLGFNLGETKPTIDLISIGVVCENGEEYYAISKDFNLKSYVQEARSKKVAIGHFNVSNLEMFHGVWNAASKLQVPVIIGVSEGERDFMGIAEVIALVRTLRERHNYPIFINKLGE